MPERATARKVSSTKSVESHIQDVLSLMLPESSSQIDPDDLLTQHGMDSIAATQLSWILSDTYGLALSPAVAFEFPTLRVLAAHVDALRRQPDCGGGRRNGRI